jgi:hypothetical protein
MAFVPSWRKRQMLEEKPLPRRPRFLGDAFGGPDVLENTGLRFSPIHKTKAVTPKRIIKIGPQIQTNSQPPLEPTHDLRKIQPKMREKVLKTLRNKRKSLLKKLKAKGKSVKQIKKIMKGGMSIEELAEISDKALNDVYHYGRSAPGKTFGWLANIESVKAASALILAGETDIEKISDAVHEGWNKTAMADYENKLVLDSPTPDDKKQKRFMLAQTTYSHLSEEEKDKDRVVARAILAAFKN